MLMAQDEVKKAEAHFVEQSARDLSFSESENVAGVSSL
jgi:hypothetical protein